MSLYEDLGVAKDASAAEIKRAFRKVASAQHPDRGGDPSKMALANVAYETLSDPDKRKRYDETGSTRKEPTIDEQALNGLRMLAASAIAGSSENTDILATIRAQLGIAMANIKKAPQDMNAKIAVLKRRRKRVVRKDGQEEGNFFIQVIDSQIAALEQQLARIAHDKIIHVRALELLNAYEFDGPKAGPEGYYHSQSFSSNFFAQAHATEGDE